MTMIAITQLLLTSCDPRYSIKYAIANDTEKQLIAKYKFSNGIDTSLILKAHSINTIYEEAGVGYVKGKIEVMDSLPITTLIIKQGNKLIRHRYKDKKEWKLNIKNNQEAIFLLSVEDTI